MNDRTDRYRATPAEQARADSDIRISAVLTAGNAEREREAIDALTEDDRRRIASMVETVRRANLAFRLGSG